MHTDAKELLIGSAMIVLFGVALIVSPPFAQFVGRLAFCLKDLATYCAKILAVA
jgi:hypothetical protein